MIISCVQMSTSVLDSHSLQEAEEGEDDGLEAPTRGGTEEEEEQEGEEEEAEEEEEGTRTCRAEQSNLMCILRCPNKSGSRWGGAETANVARLSPYFALFPGTFV